LQISSSIGVAIYPEHGENEINLAKNADIAMYYSKEQGRNNVQIFQREMVGE
ncbi:MAG: diguanylate cyclase, partial [Methylococcaceae bacterium]|nr:diguanylate cyclase [Methylococcaceae bacterium]